MIHAVQLILKFESKYFFIKRKTNLKIFPGYQAFPGGKVESHETELEALTREIFEELDFKIKTTPQKIGHAITPDFYPYRYKSSYFFLELNDLPSFKLDQKEIEEGMWLTREEFIKKFQTGDLIVIPPIFLILNHLEENEPTLSSRSFNLSFEDNQVPLIESISEVYQLMPLSNTLPPAKRTNSFIIGDTLIDPSPKDKNELHKYLESLKKYHLNNLFISHHHADHHQFAPFIAKKLGLKIYISKDSCERIQDIDKNYFNHLDLNYVRDGEVLCQWKGEDVLLMHVPGHDEGQFALYPISKKWFLASDLFQGIGTVVVGGREGSMKKYMQSLQKVIELNPKALYPSHGIVLGAVDILKRTLRHRELREKQIYELYQNGKSLEQMLQIIYFDLPQELKKYAKANIESHIIKLKEDGKIPMEYHS